MQVMNDMYNADHVMCEEITRHETKNVLSTSSS